MIKNDLKGLKEKTMNFIKFTKEYFQYMKEDFTSDFKNIWKYRFYMKEEPDKEKACEYKAKYFDAKEEFYGHINEYLLVPGTICVLLLIPVVFQHLKYIIRGVDPSDLTEFFEFYKIMVPATVITFGGSFASIFISEKYYNKYREAHEELEEIRNKKWEEAKKEKEKQKVIEENKKEQVIEKSIDDKKEELIALKDELLSLKQENTEEKAIVLVNRIKNK